MYTCGAGQLVVRDRMLAALGFTVISVPSWQWEGLASPAEQRSYLAAQLRPHIKLP